MTLVLRYIARSDQGLVRSNNEDSAYAGPRLLALADGMGGHAAGEVASRLVIEALRSLDDDDPGDDLLGALDRATQAGNQAIADQVEQKPDLDGMGTTLTAILFAGSRIGLCHVGDSRGYLFRDGEITQITRDDTFVQTLVDEGRITAEQAHTHPQRSLIMRALTGHEVEPTLTMREARPGDRYLLCSDGLSDVVSEETLAETLGSIREPRDCADRLIELALRGGGPDNVTVVLADVVDTDFGESRPIIGGAAGSGEDAYQPDPKTAAGRAAALRPPLTRPQQPTLLPDDAPPPRRRLAGRWIIIGIIVLVVAVLLAGFLVLRGFLRGTYYVGEQDNKVLIFQGSPDGFLGYRVNNPTEKGCIKRPESTDATITFVPIDADCARPLAVDDLASASMNSVRSHDISGKPLDEVRTSAITMQLRALCPDDDTTPIPPDRSMPGNRSSTTPSQQPAPTTPSATPATASPTTPLPAPPPATGTIEPRVPERSGHPDATPSAPTDQQACRNP
ncbi:MAG: protein phosphatase 2C domain-containing protein [Gordonia sp. (in: high G+C Gram-positive bacteria)]